MEKPTKTQQLVAQGVPKTRKMLESSRKRAHRPRGANVLPTRVLLDVWRTPVKPEREARKVKLSDASELERETYFWRNVLNARLPLRFCCRGPKSLQKHVDEIVYKTRLKMYGMVVVVTDKFSYSHPIRTARCMDEPEITYSLESRNWFD